MFDLNIYSYPVSEQPTTPGLMVFPPSRKSARGRENDLLVVYFSLAGQTSITAAGLADWMTKKAEKFQHNPGTVTAGMREFVESVNSDLYDRNLHHAPKGSQVTLNLQVAVIKRDIIYLATCGDGRSFFVSAQNTLSLRDSENAGRGLGVSQSVAIRFSQSLIAEDDLLLLSFNTPDIWTEDIFNHSHSLSVEAIFRRLFSISGDSGRGVLIRFKNGSGQVHYQKTSSPATAEIVTPAPEPTAAVSPVKVAAEIPLQPLETTPKISTNFPTPVAAENVQPKPPLESVPPAAAIPIATVPTTESNSPAESMKEIAAERPAESRTPLIETAAVKAAVGKTLRKGAAVKNQADSWVKDLVQKILPGEPEQLPKLSKRLLIFIAVAVPVIIVAIAATFYIRNGRNDLFSQYLAVAQQAAQRADTQNGDNATRLAGLQEAMYWLDKADSYGKTADSISLRNNLQSGIDSIEGIIGVDMTSALSVGVLPGANITQMVATNSDLYALDSNTGDVLRFTLNGSSYQEDTTFACGPDNKNPLNQIGKLVDMVPITPDNSYNATVMAIDSSGTLDYCVPGSSSYTVKLTQPDMGWGSINSISLSQGNLYLLDIRGNAVYRYEGNGVDFTGQPTLFFDDQIPPLSDALDIEVSGYELYILRANGQMIECTYSPLKDYKSTTCTNPAPYLDARSGQETTVTSFPEAQFTQMRMTDAPDSSIYLLDSGKDTVYHFSYARSLQRILNPRLMDGTDASKVVPTAFAVSPNRILFIAYGNQIYFGQIP